MNHKAMRDVQVRKKFHHGVLACKACLGVSRRNDCCKQSDRDSFTLRLLTLFIIQVISRTLLIGTACTFSVVALFHLGSKIDSRVAVCEDNGNFIDVDINAAV